MLLAIVHDFEQSASTLITFNKYYNRETIYLYLNDKICNLLQKLIVFLV